MICTKEKKNTTAKCTTELSSKVTTEVGIGTCQSPRFCTFFHFTPNASRSAHRTTITYTFTQMLIRRVVGESLELVLNGLTEMRVFHNRVLCGLVGKIGIKVSNVKNGFLIWGKQ